MIEEQQCLGKKQTAFVSPLIMSEHLSVDNTLRPILLRDYIGQKNACEQLRVFIQAAQSRNDPLDHVLISGAPGLGKTTLAAIIASEMKVSLKQTSGPAIEKIGDLAALLTNLKPHDILFIDEIHRLSPVLEEILYPALEDYRLDIIVGEGPAARTVRLNLPPFTLVCATTRSALLSRPLRDRFGIIFKLDFYEDADLATILTRSAGLLNIKIDQAAALLLARCSRGTPRIANRILRRVRDFAQVIDSPVISKELVQHALIKLNIDTYGLDQVDRAILETIIENFSGGPVGIDSLAACIGESKETLEEVVEPYLILNGFLQRTARGRIVTDKTYKHLGFIRPK